MKILFVGAGATGGFYGAKLIEAGRDVMFLVRPRRAEQIRAHGLEIVSPGASFKVNPRIVTADDLRASAEPIDLIVVGTKSYHLKGAMEDFAPAVGPETMLLPILNGMRQLNILDERFGAERVLGGTVRIVSDLDEMGRVHQLATLDEMSYGERTGERTPRIEAVDAAMQGAGFDARLQPDILATMWQKWWLLASMGTVCVLARGAAGEVGTTRGGEKFAEAVVRECAAVAEANGYPADQGLLRSHVRRMTELESTLTSSMYRDMIKGAPVEADHILGDLLDRANGVHTPLLNAAYVQLQVYQNSRSEL